MRFLELWAEIARPQLLIVGDFDSGKSAGRWKVRRYALETEVCRSRSADRCMREGRIGTVIAESHYVHDGWREGPCPAGPKALIAVVLRSRVAVLRAAIRDVSWENRAAKDVLLEEAVAEGYLVALRGVIVIANIELVGIFPVRSYRPIIFNGAP